MQRMELLFGVKWQSHAKKKRSMLHQVDRLVSHFLALLGVAFFLVHALLNVFLR